MLDNLGLGIVLTMQDDFTPQANRAVQSMNRLTSSAEQMERDMQRSMSNLQNIMLAGFSLTQVGGEFDRMGKQILGVFSGITKEIVAVNSQFDSMKAQFKTVFGEMANQKMKWAMDFSIKTPFKVDETSRMLQMMKYQGVDVTKEFRTAKGEMKSLMEYMGDFSTKNMQQGIQGLAYALSNAMGGNFRSIRMRFDLSKEQETRLKNALSGGKDKFMEEFAKLADEITPNAMRNMLGTWQQIITEMEDTWDVFIFQVGEAGAFDPMKKTLQAFSTALSEVANNETSIKNIAGVIRDLWRPVDAVARGLIKVVQWVTEFALQHPTLTKIFAGFMAFNGVMLILTGTIMKTAGMFLILSTSIVSAYANLRIMNTLGSVSMFSGLGLKIGAITRAFSLFGLVMGIVALGFKNNVGGMRDSWGEFTTEWDKSGQLLEGGLGEGLAKTEVLFGDTINSLTQKLMKFRLIGTVLFNTLFGKTVNGALQYTQKDIENLRVMGLLPFAQTMAMIRGRVKSFAEGLETGLTKAYEVAKNFLDFALIPIKAIFETISNSAPIKAISSIFGIQGEQGINMGDASGQMAQFEKLGEIAGSLVGTLIGFKVVGSLTSILTSPFKGLFDILNKTRGASDNLQSSMDGVAGNGTGGTRGGLFSRARNFVTGARDRGGRARDRFNEYLTERSDLPSGRFDNNVVDGYSRVNPANLPRRYRDYILSQNPNSNSRGVFARNQNRITEALFGAQYYSQNDDGSMRGLGRYGGRLMQDRDDNQLRLAIESGRSSRLPNSRDLYSVYDGDAGQLRFDRANYIRTNNQVGVMSNLRNNPYQQQEQEFRGQLDSRLNSLYADPQFRSQAYRNAGVNGRMFNGMDNIADPVERARRQRQQQSIFRSYASQDEGVQQLQSRIGHTRRMGGQDAIYQSGNQSRLGQFLFGQRFYTPEMDENGRMYERTVARRGGIFRRASQDMVYNDEGDTSLRGRLNRAGLGRVTGAIGRARGAVGSRLGAIREQVGQSALGRAFGRAREGVGSALGALNPLNAINRQRQRLGWGNLTWRNTTDAKGNTQRGVLSRIGSGLFGRAQYDEEGNMTNRGGLFSRAGRGARRVAGGIGRGIGAVGRGIGAVGRGAMMAMPLVTGALSVGKMGYDAITKMGGEDGFEGGVKVLRDKISKMDFGKMFTNMKGEFTKNIKAFLPLVQDVFKKIAQELPTILKQAWEGIKAGASLAWQFISEHGMTLLAGFVDLVKPVLGNIWTWLTTDGLEKIGNFIGMAVEWLIGTGVPMLIQALLGIGEWLITEGVPGLLKIVTTLALDIGKGLFDGIVNVLGGLGNALGKVMLGALKGVIRLLLPQPVEGIVISALGLDDVPTHHQGLWMSPDEHSAVIKKDETVLPPDKSRKLDDFLENPRPRKPQQPQSVDNSIKIDKVEVIVQADKLSRSEARSQAKMILEEFKKLQKEKNIRKYV